MAHRKFDLVQETSTSTGSVTMALASAASITRRRFSAVLANGDTCYVLIEHASAAEWQICLATWNTGHTLTLGTVLSSSTGSAVSFSAGTKTISMVAPADKSVVMDNNGDAPVTRDLAVGRHLNVQEEIRLNSSAVVFISGNYQIIAVGGVTAISMGNITDPRHYHQADSHEFLDRAGVVPYATLGALGFALGHSNSAAASTSPLVMDLGDTYSSVAGSHPKLKLFNNGSTFYGFGVSAQHLEYHAPTSGLHSFYCGATIVGEFTEALWLPGADNTSDLGSASKQFKGCFLVNAPTVSSGRAGKRNFRGPSDAEKRVAARLRGRAQFYQRAESIEEKGAVAFAALTPEEQANSSIEAEGAKLARWRFGIVAEDVQADFEAEGLDAGRYDIFNADPVMAIEHYTVPSRRVKTEEYDHTDRSVRIIDGKPVLVTTVGKRRRDVGSIEHVKDEAGEPVMVETGRRDPATGAPILAPMTSFVPEMEDYDAPATREVPTGEMHLALRYEPLMLFMAWAGG